MISLSSSPARYSVTNASKCTLPTVDISELAGAVGADGEDGGGWVVQEPLRFNTLHECDPIAGAMVGGWFENTQASVVIDAKQEVVVRCAELLARKGPAVDDESQAGAGRTVLIGGGTG